MYTKARLVECEALPIETPADVMCQLCSNGAVAAWRVSLRTRETLLAPSVLRADVLACKAHCFPLQSNAVSQLVTTRDRFLVKQRASRLTYAHLIDACARNMPLVLGDRRLNDIYQRVATLGETLGKGELDYAWMRLNAHFARPSDAAVIY